MKATDEILQRQLYEFASQARKATAAETVVIVVNGHDEDADREATVVGLSVRDSNDDDILDAVQCLGEALACILATTGTELFMRTADGQEVPVKVDNPRMVSNPDDLDG